MIVLCCIMLKQENIDSVFGFMRSDGTWNYGIITWSKYILLIGFPWCKVKSVYKKPHPSAPSWATQQRQSCWHRTAIKSGLRGQSIWESCRLSIPEPAQKHMPQIIQKMTELAEALERVWQIKNVQKICSHLIFYGKIKKKGCWWKMTVWYSI